MLEVEAFIKAAEAMHGKGVILTRASINAICNRYHLPFPHWLVDDQFKVGRGQWRVPVIPENRPIPASQPTHVEPEIEERNVTPMPTRPARKVAPQPEQPAEPQRVLSVPVLQDDSAPEVPETNPTYQPFGFFEDMIQIINCGMFFPVMISGHSGNGKTLMVEQACARLNRECIRVNISRETDQFDLIGGPALVDGNTVNRDGPVITAMKKGCILLLDEIDRGTDKLMCLQAIMEGKPFYNKRTGEVVHPEPGFNVIATANTKGRGSEEGRYLAQILDEAFLERFAIHVEQDFPPKNVEENILLSNFSLIFGSKLDKDTKDFAHKLVEWSDGVRKAFDEGAVGDVISTRRLVFVAQTYAVFKDRAKAINLAIARFDDDTKKALLDLYKMHDQDAAEASLRGHSPLS